MAILRKDMRTRLWLKTVIKEQEDWIKACGGPTMQGYLDHYVVKFGRTEEEAFQIWQADMKVLDGFKLRLENTWI
jgi:hypothetical protein